MRLSARNVLKGVVKSIDVGAINVEVVIEIGPDTTVTSIITKKSFISLGLEVGKEAYAVVKASDITVGVD